MMSSISPKEEQPNSRAKKSFKTLYDESMASLQTDGLSSCLDHPGLMRSDTDLLPARDGIKTKKRCPIRHQDRVRWDNDGNDGSILDI